MECYRCPYQCLCQDFLMDMNCEDALNYTKEEDDKMRLTKHGGHYCDDCGYIRDGYCRCDKEIEMYDKLAAYEDAEEQGLLVRLPCKVGDTVYEVSVNTEACGDCDHYSDFYGMDAMCDINLNSLYPTVTDEPLCEKQFFEIIQYQLWDDYFLRKRNIDAFGKTVFLTREEAEAALKGKKDDA